MSDLILRRDVLSRLEGVRPSGNGKYMARCPMPDHDDRKASVSIGPGHTQPVVMNCKGCEADAQAIADAAGIDWALVSNPRERTNSDPWAWMPCVKNEGHRWKANYTYTDQHGTPVFGVARCYDKCFGQFRVDPTHKMGRRWGLTGADGIKVGDGLIYRLPEVLAAKEFGLVYVVEGEKDANRLWSDCGMPATCNAGGGGSWTEQHAAWLAGYDVIVVADRDEKGRAHADLVIETLMPIAASIEVAQAAHGKDTSDHFDGGGNLGDFIHCGTPKSREWQHIGRAA